MKPERRFAYVNGRLREVKENWIWLFRLLQIGYELPDKSQALIEAMEAMETCALKCQLYVKASECEYE